MIETPRLLIRRYTADDCAALEEILTSAATMRFWPRPLTPDESREWVLKNIERAESSIYGRCALVLRESGRIIGDAGVVRAAVAGIDCNDLGYIVHQPYWGRGIGTEAAAALMGHYFDVERLDSLCAQMAWDHHASRRVAEKLGMRKILEFDNPRNRGLRSFLYRIERAERGR